MSQSPKMKKPLSLLAPLCPVTPQAPHWMGADLNASSDATPTAPVIGSAMHVDGGGHNHWMEQSAPWVSKNVATHSVTGGVKIQPGFEDPIAAGKQVVLEYVSGKKSSEFVSVFGAPKPRLKSVIFCPSVRHDPEDPLIVVVPSLLKKVLIYISIKPSSSFLNCLTHVDLDYGTLIPVCFHDNDLLIYLAFIIYP